MTKKLNFINLKYKPKNDLICLFKISPNKISIEKAANTVALESSVGTWTKVAGQEYVEKLKAKVFSIRGNYIKIAYPEALFERPCLCSAPRTSPVRYRSDRWRRPRSC